MIPPYVSEIFFNNSKVTERKRRIVMFPKFDQTDYCIVKNLLERKINAQKKGIFTRNEWELIELNGYTHNEVAEILKKSEIFIALNTFESLNASVVEAMAAGSLVFTYEGYGSRDYLKDAENAFVFRNNEPYKLVYKLIEIIDDFDSNRNLLNSIRQNGYRTAHLYNRSNMELKLLEFFNRKFG